ncbi:MAG: hypothetical protein ACO3YY_03525 [Phycisphaerales bacterium]
MNRLNRSPETLSRRLAVPARTPLARSASVAGLAGLAIGVLMVLPVACDDVETWTYQGISETQWRRLAESDGSRSDEARRVMLLMDENTCRAATTELLADLDASESHLRIAALQTLATEPAYRRWFPSELREAVTNRALAWNAPVGDPRRESWASWVERLAPERRGEGQAIVRALASDPDTALGMAGPGRIEAMLEETRPSSGDVGRLRALR